MNAKLLLRITILQAAVPSFIAITVANITITAQTTDLLFNYFKPTPIVCLPLTSNIWGASGVLPRDKCNGLQDQPTYTYPQNEIPSNNLASVYPVRPKHSTDDPTAPSSIEAYNLIEDPVIWYSGGMYHVVYDYPDDRVGYHLTSKDGIHDWTDQGFAYDPRQAKQLFSYTNGTIEHWYKMERPNIYMEDGHIKFFTFAVTDVDKGQITGGSNHANNVIVMSFDGVAFDTET